MLIKKGITVLIISNILLILIPLAGYAQSSALKAAFLYHFTEYIDWRNVKMETFNFAVLEKSPVTEQMKIIANENEIKNKKIKVKEYATLESVEDCHILFIPETCTVSTESILTKFAGKPVLIVTEKTGSGKKGAHINFLVSENKLRFEINLKAFKSSDIAISSQLLQHAITVY